MRIAEFEVDANGGTVAFRSAIPQSAIRNFFPLLANYLDVKIIGVSETDPSRIDSSGVHLWLILMKAYRALAQVDARSISASGLGLSDFAVLEILLHKGPLPVNTIGRQVMLTSGSITTAVDRLEKKKLVGRQACPNDRRVTYVTLTTSGRTLIRRVFKVHTKRLETMFEPLSAAERITLARLLKKLGKHAESLLSQGG
jgi:MarR family transcriptional regulator, 2-MHQ and catechol-resistance regulon repressor